MIKITMSIEARGARAEDLLLEYFPVPNHPDYAVVLDGKTYAIQSEEAEAHLKADLLLRLKQGDDIKLKVKIE